KLLSLEGAGVSFRGARFRFLFGCDIAFAITRLALEILLGLDSEIVRAHVAGRARMIDHVRIRIDLDRLEESGQADAIDGLADALMLERVLDEEVDQLAPEFDQLLVILVGLELHERNDHDAHEVADLERALAADQDSGAAVV